MTETAHDPVLDLTFARDVDLPPATIWAAWTRSELLTPWFCPRPWSVTACDIDLRPGGVFRTVMRSPDGQEFANVGCYLEVRPPRRLVWTNAVGPGFRPLPAADSSFAFTGILSLTPLATGTRYQARVIHGSAADCRQHAAMGFELGWGIALDQLVAFMKSREGNDGPLPSEVVGIDHAYLAVSDLRRSESFYDLALGEALGFRKNRFAIGDEPHVQYFNRHFGLVLRPARRHAPHDPYSPGLHHLCLRVDDIADVQAAAARLRTLRVGASEAGHYPEYAEDYWACFFTDPDGVRFEVTNYRAERRQRHDHWDDLPA